MMSSGSGRDRISDLLLEIRGRRTQVEAATRSGIGKPTISQAERGKLTMRPDMADRYARALRATAEQRAELVDLCQAIADLTVTSQTRVTRKGVDAQRRILAVEQQSREIRSWQIEIVPGLLQTWSYTVAVLGREPTDEWAAARRERLALLDDPDRALIQLVTEGVLRTVIGSTEVMREQLDHLIDVSRRPNVHIGVLPQNRLGPVPMPSFHLYSDRLATNETVVGVAYLAERPDLDQHRRAFDLLWSGAVLREDARNVMAARRGTA